MSRYKKTSLLRLYRVNVHVDNMLEKGQITEDTCKYLTKNNDRTQFFYMSPQIDKGLNNHPGRPVVSGSDNSTEKMSQFVDHFLNTFIPLSKYFVRDSTHTSTS